MMMRKEPVGVLSRVSNSNFVLGAVWVRGVEEEEQGQRQAPWGSLVTAGEDRTEGREVMRVSGEQTLD